jgi:hypothetical protein
VVRGGVLCQPRLIAADFAFVRLTLRPGRCG